MKKMLTITVFADGSMETVAEPGSNGMDVLAAHLSVAAHSIDQFSQIISLYGVDRTLALDNGLEAVTREVRNMPPGDIDGTIVTRSKTSECQGHGAGTATRREQ